eukprot:GHVU01230922.1.p1 GENE.GHVU01230922.1~~GHVU01230922.1.p1  ORF type:complete len:582 (-),score=146.21 GHVU01230922.1:63-1808(-)
MRRRPPPPSFAAKGRQRQQSETTSSGSSDGGGGEKGGPASGARGGDDSDDKKQTQRLITTPAMFSWHDALVVYWEVPSSKAMRQEHLKWRPLSYMEYSLQHDGEKQLFHELYEKELISQGDYFDEITTSFSVAGVALSLTEKARERVPEVVGLVTAYVGKVADRMADKAWADNYFTTAARMTAVAFNSEEPENPVDQVMRCSENLLVLTDTPQLAVSAGRIMRVASGGLDAEQRGVLAQLLEALRPNKADAVVVIDRKRMTSQGLEELKFPNYDTVFSVAPLKLPPPASDTASAPPQPLSCVPKSVDVVLAPAEEAAQRREHCRWDGISNSNSNSSSNSSNGDIAASNTNTHTTTTTNTTNTPTRGLRYVDELYPETPYPPCLIKEDEALRVFWKGPARLKSPKVAAIMKLRLANDSATLSNAVAGRVYAEAMSHRIAAKLATLEPCGNTAKMQFSEGSLVLELEAHAEEFAGLVKTLAGALKEPPLDEHSFKDAVNVVMGEASDYSEKLAFQIGIDVLTSALRRHKYSKLEIVKLEKSFSWDEYGRAVEKYLRRGHLDVLIVGNVDAKQVSESVSQSVSQ